MERARRLMFDLNRDLMPHDLEIKVPDHISKRWNKGVDILYLVEPEQIRKEDYKLIIGVPELSYGDIPSHLSIESPIEVNTSLKVVKPDFENHHCLGFGYQTIRNFTGSASGCLFVMDKRQHGSFINEKLHLKNF